MHAVICMILIHVLIIFYVKYEEEANKKQQYWSHGDEKSASPEKNELANNKKYTKPLMQVHISL